MVKCLTAVVFVLFFVQRTDAFCINVQKSLINQVCYEKEKLLFVEPISDQSAAVESVKIESKVLSGNSFLLRGWTKSISFEGGQAGGSGIYRTIGLNMAIVNLYKRCFSDDLEDGEVVVVRYGDKILDVTREIVSKRPNYYTKYNLDHFNRTVSKRRWNDKESSFWGKFKYRGKINYYYDCSKLIVRYSKYSHINSCERSGFNWNNSDKDTGSPIVASSNENNNWTYYSIIFLNRFNTGRNLDCPWHLNNLSAVLIKEPREIRKYIKTTKDLTIRKPSSQILI